ncbi:MAG: hypothetical protein WCO09_03625, partial [bacterium]
FAFLFLYVVFLVASLIFSVYDIVLLKQFGARIFTWLNIFLSIIVLFIFYTAFMSAVSNSLFYNLSDKAERSGNLNDCRAPAFIVFISDYDENRCTLYIKK